VINYTILLQEPLEYIYILVQVPFESERYRCGSVQYSAVRGTVTMTERVARRRDSSLPTRVCVPLVFNKVYKVSTITIDLLLLLLYYFKFAFRPQGKI